jgi:DNA repair protein RadC
MKQLKPIDYTQTEPDGYKAIRDWREDERPRERLLKNGASSLSDAEILAILISSGTKKFSALDIARSLLEKHSSLANLASCDPSEFRSVRGLGPARAVTLSAAFELSRRIESEPFDSRKVIHGPEDIAGYYIPRFRGARAETFHVLLLNTSNHIFRDVLVSQGSLNASIVHPREVFRTAITESAAGIILLHNHPSGNPEPSNEDINITRQLVSAGKLIDIKVLDHIIIAGEAYTSLVQRGII